MNPLFPYASPEFARKVKMARLILNGHRAIDISKRYGCTPPGVMSGVRTILKAIVKAMPEERKEEAERMYHETSLSSQNFYRDRAYWSNHLATVESEWLPTRTREAPTAALSP